MEINQLSATSARTIAVEVATKTMESVRANLAAMLAPELAKAGVKDAWRVADAISRNAGSNYALGNATDDIVSALDAGIQYAAIAMVRDND